jgi:1-acyl-sn-glycerol-3-phosphate acyltransferase
VRHPQEHPWFQRLGGAVGAAMDRFVDEEIRERVEAMDIHAGAHGYDGWGGSKLASTRALGVARFFYRHYFRVETEGLENVPEGRCLLIGNHSGQLPIDGLIVAAALALDGHPPRYVHAMIERFFAGIPFVGVGMSRVGQQIGLPQHCERLLTRDDAAVLVFPEGQRGSGRVVWDRYKLLQFGSGFMRLALRTGTPIVPFGFVGGEEMAMSFSRMEPIARRLGLPYLPLSPTLLPLPMPAKCMLNVGAPLRFEGTGNEPDEVVLSYIDEVKTSIADQIAIGRARRRHPYFG